MKGAWLIALGGLIGAAVSAFYYVVPGYNLDGEGGVMLVIISCLLMLVAALALLGLRGGLVAGLLVALILLDILGTGLCAWFLEAPVLLAAMALALLGWVIRAIGNAADKSVEVA